MKLTLYFDGQFWLGIVEDNQDGFLRVCKHIFGKEPKDEEVQYFVNHIMMRLLERVTTGVKVNQNKEQHINPKRLARAVGKEMKQKGASTKAQEALKLELENRKVKRKVLSREQIEEEKEKKRQLKVEKRKKKHRGR
ncbi:MAG: YjdF family protein [Bacillota bacterium]